MEHLGSSVCTKYIGTYGRINSTKGLLERCGGEVEQYDVAGERYIYMWLLNRWELTFLKFKLWLDIHFPSFIQCP
jgi:hypothetical protein